MCTMMGDSRRDHLVGQCQKGEPMMNGPGYTITLGKDRLDAKYGAITVGAEHYVVEALLCVTDDITMRAVQLKCACGATALAESDETTFCHVVRRAADKLSDHAEITSRPNGHKSGMCLNPLASRAACALS